LPDPRGFETGIWPAGPQPHVAARPCGAGFLRELDAPPPPPPDVVPRAVLEQAIAKARADGYRDGEAAAASGIAQAVAAVLDRIATELSALRAAAEQVAVASARDVAALLLAALGRALPGFAAERTEAAVMEIAALVRPVLAQGGAAVRVAPPHADGVARAVAGAGLALRVIGDEDIAPGDAVLAWDGGSARRELAAVWAEISAALAAAGLLADGATDHDG